MDKDVEAALQPNGGLFSGSLYDLGWYLAWTTGHKVATLDGEFTAQQLRDIADVMDGKTEE